MSITIPFVHTILLTNVQCNATRPLVSATLSILETYSSLMSCYSTESLKSCGFASIGLALSYTAIFHQWVDTGSGAIQSPGSGHERYLSWSGRQLSWTRNIKMSSPALTYLAHPMPTSPRSRPSSLALISSRLANPRPPYQCQTYSVAKDRGRACSPKYCS